MARSLRRDLLPLPLPFEDVAVRSERLCRHSVRRVQKRLRQQQWANDAVFSISEMYGVDSSSSSQLFTPSLGQRSCLDNVAASIFRIGDPPSGVTAAGSFNQICGTSAGYGEHGVSARVPLDPRLLALPSLGSVPGDPSRFLSGSDLQQWENWRENILVSPAVARERREQLPCKRPYTDPG